MTKPPMCCVSAWCAERGDVADERLMTEDALKGGAVVDTGNAAKPGGNSSKLRPFGKKVKHTQ